MKRRFLVASSIIAIMVLTILVIKPWGSRPFAKLQPQDIAQAELLVIPPEMTVAITQEQDMEQLAEILQGITTYRQDETGREYAGQLVQVTVILTNGEVHTVGAYNPFAFLDGSCYRTKYQPCEELNAFGNQFINKG